MQNKATSIRCKKCNITSYNLNDVERKYCGSCNRFHGSPDEYELGAAPQLSFRHYKGGSYTLLMVGRSSEARDEHFAVYVSRI